jgi:hypothetical protein
MLKVEFGLPGLQVLYAASLVAEDDPEFTYRRYVLVRVKHGHVKVAATNGTMLAFYDRPGALDFECDGEGEVLIPAKFIASSWKERKNVGKVTLVLDKENKATLYYGGGSHYWKADCVFPDYERAIPHILCQENGSTSLIGFDARLLERTFKVFKVFGETKLQFEIPIDPLSPIVVSSVDSPIAVVVMPMRIEKRSTMRDLTYANAAE